MLFINAAIETVENGFISCGYIKIENGMISAVGEMPDCPDDCDIMDLEGYTIYPGFVDGHCHLGMWEDSIGFEGDDGNEDTDPLTPQLSALDAVNPMDRCFQEAREAGVTTVVTGPGSANPIGGAWIAVKTAGRRIDDMVVKSPVGIKFALGENPKSSYRDKNQMPVTRMATAALIREQLEKARRYMKSIDLAKRDTELDEPEFDAKCHALVPLLERKIKAFFHAHRADDIFTAIRIAKEFNLDYILVHATDGYKIGDIIMQEQANVVAGPMICDRSKPELRGQRAGNPAILEKCGVNVAICSDHPELPVQYLPLSCGLAVREGMPRDAALKAVTLLPAKMCGISDRVGSIVAGKDADMVIYKCDDDPFSVYAKPRQVLINGRRVFEESSL